MFFFPSIFKNKKMLKKDQKNQKSKVTLVRITGSWFPLSAAPADLEDRQTPIHRVQDATKKKDLVRAKYSREKKRSKINFPPQS